MRTHWLCLLAVAASCSCQQAIAPAAPVEFINALKSATLPVAVTTQGVLADTGGEKITEAIRGSQFVLLGESHFSRETPLLAAAMCKAMQPDAYAVEAGPYAAAFVNQLLSNPDRADRMREHERSYPASMAFLNGEQENDLASRCASSRHDRVPLWGLDQEFIGAPAVLLRQMQQEANGPRTQAAIQAALIKDQQAEAKARSSGDATQLFLLSASDDDFMSLKAAVDADGRPTTQAMLRELTQSRHIYRLNLAKSPDSNSERATLLKQHFAEHYRALQHTTPAPRVFFKFGDNHMWKGFNDLHGLDLGDYVAELASAEHSTSLHIQVMAARSTLPSFAGYARPTKDDSSALLDQPGYGWLRPTVEMLPASQGTDLLGIVVDLRKLRFRHLELSREWEHLVYGYDLLVMFPTFTPAHLYH